MGTNDGNNKKRIGGNAPNTVVQRVFLQLRAPYTQLAMLLASYMQYGYFLLRRMQASVVATFPETLFPTTLDVSLTSSKKGTSTTGEIFVVGASDGFMHLVTSKQVRAV